MRRIIRRQVKLIHVTGPRKPPVSEAIKFRKEVHISNREVRLHRWAEPFEHLFSWPPASTHLKPTGDVDPWTVNVEPPKTSEAYDCISFLKRHRASGLGNLAVSQPSCFLWVAWQLGTERVLQLNNVFLSPSISVLFCFGGVRTVRNRSVVTPFRCLARGLKHFQVAQAWTGTVGVRRLGSNHGPSVARHLHTCVQLNYLFILFIIYYTIKGSNEVFIPPDKQHEPEVTRWLRHELTDQNIHVLNPTPAFRLLLSKLGQPGGVSDLVLPSDGMAVSYRKGVTTGRLFIFIMIISQLTHPRYQHPDTTSSLF
ncbi:hypothetical protein CSKR_111099 [Clonorchis sinensis]|uniref:Uncharacterized protein n=1 Tax=Clonorchis sinensis TaxID=79923 RepID=A0A419Q379_CLOSI|nr:hypothetical protein CSKR_111099 [Clonorchis sinensis]